MEIIYVHTESDRHKRGQIERRADRLEKIAENVHEVRAQGRIAERWRYGVERSDKDKTTPCLVPYSELSEAEKEYDRNTALETLKLIMALGYDIEKNKQ